MRSARLTTLAVFAIWSHRKIFFIYVEKLQCGDFLFFTNDCSNAINEITV